MTRSGEAERLDRGGGRGSLATISDGNVVSAYARWAPVYDWSFGFLTRRARIAAVAELNTLPPSRIVELGVGTGISLPLYERHHRITGVDLSRDMLDRARKRVAEDSLGHVEGLHEMDAGDLAFPDGAFDAAMAMFVITVVPHPEQVLAEMARVVRPGGRVLIVNHFSVDKGPRAAIERRMARFSAKLGWRPDFPVETVLGRPELRLVERRSVTAMDIFSLLVFERVETGTG
jgi:phosphatidylethanolamine/phosphatidyl-N-methylethanolamine N-methyltransferase